MTLDEKKTVLAERDETEIGSVFVSNYPPYSFWNPESVPNALRAVESEPIAGRPLGLYMHIPFCRKRCKFCYFRVYTGKNADEIEQYLDALTDEIDLYGKMPSVSGRSLKFVYFGGGTPSFISVKHLRRLVQRAKRAMDWSAVEEVAFECEPGTLSQPKLEAIREIGVNRLSLGIENFNDQILRENGRAHVSKEIFRVQPWIKELNFDQVNIDLIAGMIGETWETWKETVQKAVDFEPDAVTIYQMELPYNTVYSKAILDGEMNRYVADWKTKREWHEYAIEAFESAGYTISSAYTLVKDPASSKFVYRDALWRGSDMVPTGVASFGHMSNVHYQNVDSWDRYIEMVGEGRLPVDRAFETTEAERLTREVILQLKSGVLDRAYFSGKFSVDILEAFKDPFGKLRDAGMIGIEENRVVLTRKGLLRADQLLEAFYDLRYRDARYT